MKKDGYTRKTARKKGSGPLKPFLSKDDNNRRPEPKTRDVARNCKAILLRNSENPRIRKNFGTIKSLEEEPSNYWSDGQRSYNEIRAYIPEDIRPGDKSGDPKYVRWDKSSQLARKRLRKIH